MPCTSPSCKATICRTPGNHHHGTTSELRAASRRASSLWEEMVLPYNFPPLSPSYFLSSSPCQHHLAVMGVEVANVTKVVGGEGRKIKREEEDEEWLNGGSHAILDTT
uniref:Uncharacterized protein n=1 Tax=Oryza nivara TaxID=4536 RepID=A0A0E0GY76_ORYNI